MLGGIVKSISGISKAVTGTTKNFRQVLAANPRALNLVLPPQVSMGIKVANQLGLKIPSEDVLKSKAMSELDKVVFGTYRPNTDDLIRALKGETRSDTPGLDRYLDQLRKSGKSVLDQIESGQKTVEDVLNSINWLL